MKKMNVIRLNAKVILRTWLAWLGVIASLLSVLLTFWSLDDLHITSTYLKCLLLILICIAVLFASALWVCVLRKSKTIWEGSSGEIKACYSDILKDAFREKEKEELFVIPVNTCFDTIVDDDVSLCMKPLVSPNSLHGKWIAEMVRNGFNLEEIDERIRKNLEIQGLMPKKEISSDEKVCGKNSDYEIGTIAAVRGCNHSTFLLLALSEFDGDNVAHTTAEDLESCIKKLIEFYDRHGQGHKMSVPLMGTSLSRAGLSHDDSLRIITSLFQLYGDKVHGEIDVVIYSGDRDKVTVDL